MSKSWPRKRLGDLCQLVNGRAFKPSDWGPKGLPIVRIQNLNDPGKPFNRFGGAVSPNHLIGDGAILLSWSGTPGTSFGCFRWTRGRAVVNQHIFRVHVDENRIDGDFFISAVNSRLDEMISKAHGGVGLRHITKGKLEAIELPVPPLPEQRRIVARIKECMERIEEIERLRAEAVAEHKHLARSYYRETYFRLLAKWPTKLLGEVGTVRGGGTPSKGNPEFWKGTIPWISPKAMKQRFLSDSNQHISERALQESAATLIPPGAVLFVVRGMILVHTLPVAVNRVSAAINQDMKAITPAEGIVAEFLASMIRGAESHLLSKVEIAGHGTRRLRTGDWAATEIPIPGLDEQRKIVADVTAVEAGREALADNFDTVDFIHLRDAVLRKAFAGKL